LLSDGLQQSLAGERYTVAGINHGLARARQREDSRHDLACLQHFNADQIPRQPRDSMCSDHNFRLSSARAGELHYTALGKSEAFFALQAAGRARPGRSAAVSGKSRYDRNQWEAVMLATIPAHWER